MCCVLFLVKNMLCSVFSEEYVAFQTVVASLLKNFNQTRLNFWAIFHDTFLVLGKVVQLTLRSPLPLFWFLKKLPFLNPFQGRKEQNIVVTTVTIRLYK